MTPNPQLVPFAERIAALLFEQGFIGTRILRELRALGYAGSQTALYDYLALIKEQRTRERATMRFETGPGEQAQFDWSPYRVPLGGTERRVVVFGLILSYSRRKYYLASLDETQGSAFEALERGLAHCGGAPKRLLVDNARVFVDDARPEHFTWNARFLELCGHYQIEPWACQVRRAQTKGKIERPFFYLEEHFIKGNGFDDLDALNAALARFGTEELDQLVHGTTQEQPLARFVDEEACLTPLPAGRFVSRLDAVRQVSRDCLVSYGGSRYSVPHHYAGAQVWVRTSLGVRLEVYEAGGTLIATHMLAAKKGLSVLEQAHYAGLRQRTPVTKVVLSAACLARKRVLFTQATTLLDNLVAAQVANTLGRLLQTLRGQELLVIDELGYTAMDPLRASLFFQLVSQKYGHSSIIVTTNVAFEQWGRIFGDDDVIASAILDRLLHYAEVFAIDGPSWRLRGKLGRGGPGHGGNRTDEKGATHGHQA